MSESTTPCGWHGLPTTVRSRFVPANGLDLHILEAFPQDRSEDAPLIILLHGFPEISYSWRKIIVPLALTGYHVVAPDQRGFGLTRKTSLNAQDQTTAQHEPVKFADELSPFKMLNLVTDIVALVPALGYRTVAAVVGHDFGSTVAGFCALIRPDLFKSVVMMSAPFTGVAALPLGTETRGPLPSVVRAAVEAGLASLDPPRKHYVGYYSTPDANAHMHDPPQGLHAFLRAYFHVKSADWPHNDPKPLLGFTASSFAELPHYYIMPLRQSMPEVVATDMPAPADVAKNTWLTDDELAVYVAAFARTGFQGGLNWYRAVLDEALTNDMMVFAGKRVEVPAMYVAGKHDWGIHQHPGALQLMKSTVCERMEDEDFVIVDGAGHWVQQETPRVVMEHLMRFLQKVQSS